MKIFSVYVPMNKLILWITAIITPLTILGIYLMLVSVMEGVTFNDVSFGLLLMVIGTVLSLVFSNMFMVLRSKNEFRRFIDTGLVILCMIPSIITLMFAVLELGNLVN